MTRVVSAQEWAAGSTSARGVGGAPTTAAAADVRANGNQTSAATTADALESNEHRAMLATMNISRATDLWLSHLAGRGHSDRTTSTYRRLLDKLADEHPRHVDVEDLAAADLRLFLDRHARKRDGSRKSAATVAQNVSIVNGFFDWLTKEGVIKRNPTRRNGDQIIPRPRQMRADRNDNVTTISSADVVRLLAVANASGWPARLAVNVAVYMGPRRRALCTLRLSDYDIGGRRLTFREKGGKTISKPIPDELAAVIEAAIIAGVYDTDDDYLIPSQATQRRKGDRDDRIIWRLVKDVAVKARVNCHVHALRAAFAVHYLETHPGGLIALQELMGHERQDTTLVYLRRLDRRQQMETVRDLSWGATQTGAIAPVSGEGETESLSPETGSRTDTHPRRVLSDELRAAATEAAQKAMEEV